MWRRRRRRMGEQSAHHASRVRSRLRLRLRLRSLAVLQPLAAIHAHLHSAATHLQRAKHEHRMASVTFEDVRKVYDDAAQHVAVQGATFEVADGELMVLVGPSGSGKSTLLRMVAGLESISGGQLSIGDRVVNGIAPQDRDIAMVFQSYNRKSTRLNSSHSQIS